MTDPFIGEIRMFAGNFAPRSHAFCDGQLVAVTQNEALFSLLGTIYGGDGRTTFGLPDMRGRLPIHQGTGPGLTNRRIGAKLGTETATISAAQLPSHTHALQGVNAPGATQVPAGSLLATPTGNLYAAQAPDENMEAGAIGATGAGMAHANRMPSLCVNFIIALVGVYPSRT